MPSDQDRISPYNINTKSRRQVREPRKVSIVHFIVVSLVAKPLNRNEAKGDLVMIQTLLLFKCKLLCNHAN